MREYKIFKTDLGWGIYRRKEIGKMLIVEYFNGHGTRTGNKDSARTFYNQEDAISALVINKSKGQTDTTSTKKSGSEGKREKKSWSELS